MQTLGNGSSSGKQIDEGDRLPCSWNVLAMALEWLLSLHVVHKLVEVTLSKSTDTRGVLSTV